MKLNELDLMELIPPYMQGDNTVIGLCAAANYILNKLYHSILKMDFYTNLDSLDESDLDYIAQINNITWYNSNDIKEVKVNVIKNSEIVFWNLGTILAVEKVIADIFGDCEVIEWFNYEGEPFHFKISSFNSQITSEEISRFNAVIDHVKRKSAILDSVEIALIASMNSFYGFNMHTGDYISIRQEG